MEARKQTFSKFSSKKRRGDWLAMHVAWKVFRMGGNPASLSNEKIPGRGKREERRSEDGEMNIQR